jgi:hypothetical protein
VTRRRVTTKPGASLTPGDVIDMAVGPSIVLKAKDAHGGRELVVCHPDGGATRCLWYWPKQAVRVIRCDVKAAFRILAEIEERKEKAKGEAA